jgi:hypothetical protein
MEKNVFSHTINFFKGLSIKDIFGLLLYLAIPISFFVLDLPERYRIIYFAVLAIFIALYTLVGQFFFEDRKLSSLGKKLLALTIINTLVLSFVNYTGGINSPLFFIIYFLTFLTAIFVSGEILIFETMIIFVSILVPEVREYNSFTSYFQALSTQEIFYLLSIPLTLPLAFGVAVFMKSLQKKQDLLLLSKEMLAIRDIEDEALLEEVNQGVIVLNKKLEIIKISSWVEKNFSLTARLLLGKSVAELEFFDPVSNKKLLANDYFYKNLTSSKPQKVNWRVLYKNQYGKFIKFVIKQNPLVAGESVIGFLLSVKTPPSSVKSVVGSFNKILSFRMSSSISLLKNLFTISPQIKKDPVYPTIEKHFEFLVRLLEDTTIKDDIADGNYEINMTTFDLKVLAQKVIEKIDPIRKIAVWNISPMYRTSSVSVKTDQLLTDKLLTYSIKGALYFSKDASVSLSLDEDENLKRPRVLITVPLKEELPEVIKVVEPFFAGQIETLAKYTGTGLELSNANLIAKFLGFDFNAGIGDNRLVIKVVF